MAAAGKAAAKKVGAGASSAFDKEEENDGDCNGASEIVQDLDFFARKPMYRSVRMQLLRDSCPELVARFEAPSTPAANKKMTAGVTAAGEANQSHGAAAAKTPTPKKPKTPRGLRERSPTQHAITGFMRQRKPEMEYADSTLPRSSLAGAAPAFVDCFSPLSFASDGSEELMASGLFPLPTKRIESSPLGAATAAGNEVNEREERKEQDEEKDVEAEEEAAAAAVAAAAEDGLSVAVDFASPPASRCRPCPPPGGESTEVVDLITPPSQRRTTGVPSTPSSSTKRSLFPSTASAVVAGPAAAVLTSTTAAAGGAVVAAPAAFTPGGRGQGRCRGRGVGRPSSTPMPSTPLTSPTKRSRQVSIKNFMSPSAKLRTPGTGTVGTAMDTGNTVVLVSDDSYDSDDE